MKIENRLAKCPLCGETLETLDNEFVQEFSRKRSMRWYMLMVKIIFFIEVVIVTAMLLLNELTGFEWLWTLVVICCTVYLGISVITALRGARNIGFLVLIQSLGISAVTYVIDYAFGHYGWSLNYVLPFLLIGASLAVTLLIILSPMGLRDYIIYQFAIAAMGLVPVLLIWTEAVTVTWPSVVCAFYSAMVFFGIFLFAGRKTKHEMKKRLHF